MTKAQRQMIKEYTEKKFSTLKFKKELKLRVDIGTTTRSDVTFFIYEKTNDPRYVEGWKLAMKRCPYICTGHRRSDVLLRDYCDQIIDHLEELFGVN